MSTSRVFEDYTITTQLMEESGAFYVQFYNTLLHKKYEANVAYDTLGLPGKPAEVFNVLNYCLDKKEGYNFGFALNGSIMGVMFDAKIGGVLSVSFAITLNEISVSGDTVVSYKLNELETELKEVKEELEMTKEELAEVKEELAETKEELAETKEQLVNTKEELETTKKVVLKHFQKIQLYDVNINITNIYEYAPPTTGYSGPPPITDYTIRIYRSGKVYIAKVRRQTPPYEFNTVLLDLPHGIILPDYLLSMFKNMLKHTGGPHGSIYRIGCDMIIDSIVKCITEFNSNSACI